MNVTIIPITTEMVRIFSALLERSWESDVKLSFNNLDPLFAEGKKPGQFKKIVRHVIPKA